VDRRPSGQGSQCSPRGEEKIAALDQEALKKAKRGDVQELLDGRNGCHFKVSGEILKKEMYGLGARDRRGRQIAKDEDGEKMTEGEYRRDVKPEAVS